MNLMNIHKLMNEHPNPVTRSIYREIWMKQMGWVKKDKEAEE